MGKFVASTEAAYIRMVANRVLRLSQNAAKEGEPWRDLSQPVELMSGYRAKLRHLPQPDGSIKTIVMVWPKEDEEIVLADAAELASELLCHPAKLWGQREDHLEYVSDD